MLNSDNRETRTHDEFFADLDRMILAGSAVIDVTRALNVRERTVRRRKKALIESGHIPQLQGRQPGANNAHHTKH
jgi:hypothetical protein